MQRDLCSHSAQGQVATGTVHRNNGDAQYGGWTETVRAVHLTGDDKQPWQKARWEDGEMASGREPRAKSQEVCTDIN